MFQALAIFSMTALMVLPSAAQDTVYFSQGIAKGIVGTMPMPMPLPMPLPMPPFGPAPDEAIAAAQKALNLSEARVTDVKGVEPADGSRKLLSGAAESRAAGSPVAAESSAVEIGMPILRSCRAEHNEGDSRQIQTDRALLALNRTAEIAGCIRQIEALRMLGVLANDPRTFQVAFPPSGIGADRSIQIFRRNEATPR
jgi:hypothetical protein